MIGNTPIYKYLVVIVNPMNELQVVGCFDDGKQEEAHRYAEMVTGAVVICLDPVVAGHHPPDVLEAIRQRIPATETKQEFEYRYSEYNSKADFGNTHIALPCTCQEGGGPTHWACVQNNPEAIADHLSHERCLADLRLDP